MCTSYRSKPFKLRANTLLQKKRHQTRIFHLNASNCTQIAFGDDIFAYIRILTLNMLSCARNTVPKIIPLIRFKINISIAKHCVSCFFHE